MTSVSGAFNYRIDVSKIKKLDTSLTTPVKLSSKEKIEVAKVREMAYRVPTNLDELKNHVSQKVYAEVKVGGRTVATLYNNGVSETPNEIYSRIKNLRSMGDTEHSVGPDLAKKRAEEIAKALGGTVVKSSTAVSQSQYLATPPFEVKYKIDYAAMERDRAASLGQVSTPQTQVETQSLGGGAPAGKNVEEEFLAFAGMPWEEKVRVMILKTMGFKEEDLAGMPAEEREKIEAKIREKIEEEIEEKTGMSAGSNVSTS